MTTPQDEAPLRGRTAARLRAASDAMEMEDAQARPIDYCLSILSVLSALVR